MNICARTKTLVGTAVVVSLAVYIACFRSADPENSARPVISALKQYWLRYGSYPANLNELVELRFLRVIPTMRSDISYIRGSLEYFSDRDIDVFCLSYMVRSTWGGLGPTRVRERGYVSYLDKWVLDEAGDFDLTDPLGIAMDRAGREFRAARSSQALDLFVSKLIYYSTRSSVYPRKIRRGKLSKALGQGEFPDVDGDIRLRYTVEDSKAATYYFVFKLNPYFPQEDEMRLVSILPQDDPGSPGNLREIYKNRSDEK